MAALGVLAPGDLAAQEASAPCSACIVLTLNEGQSVIVSEPLNNLEVLLRVEGSAAEFGKGPVAAVAAIRAAGGKPGLWTRGIPGTDVLTLAAAVAHRVVFDLAEEQGTTDDIAFRLKTAATELRGIAPEVAVGIAVPGGRAGLVAALLTSDVAAYVDFAATAGAAASGPRFPRSAIDAAAVWAVQKVSEGARSSPTRWILSLPADVTEAQRLLTDVARTAPLLNEGLIAGGVAEVRCGEAPIPTYLDPESLETVSVATGCDRSLAITPDLPGVTRVTTTAGEIVVRVPAPEGRFAEGVQVVGARRLGVREIVARHQAAAARQRRAVRTVISSGSMTLTFEAPGFPAPMAITSGTVIYSSPDRTEIEQRDVRINGIAFEATRVPRLPLLEPERVASPPLAIALTDVYRYTLDGEEPVAGVPCYVVRFEPVDRHRTLFAGRAWIAIDTFAMVRVSAVQTALRGPIVSSEQTDEFRREGDSAWLLARSEVRQLYEGAGHRTAIHRVMAIDRHEINAPAFEARRQSAYASPAVMLRDTAEGYRYLRRDPPGDGPGGRMVERVVAGQAERVRTVAVGVILDPNISQPLPFAGLSYVDFNLFGTGTQFNGFFGGTYGQLAVSAPSLAGTRWQLAGRAFGIASSYNDRAFVDGRERYEANISQRPAHASAWLLRPLSARLTARAGYEFDYTHFGRADATDPSFVVPASQQAHAVRLALEGQWGGWSASVWWSGARRAGWRRWGSPGADGAWPYQGSQQDYQRFGTSAARSIVVSPRLVGRLEGAWMGGADLDRFSRYAFGSFDNRLRGYPAALIRYDRGAVLRGSLAWAAGRLLRIDGFADTAYVHDPGFGPSSRNYNGIGAAAEMPAPFGTLLAVEWGYGFQGVNTDGRRGTQVVRISGYKMF
jgi:hypothetical protein